MAKTKIEVDLVVKGDESVSQVEGKVVSLKQQLKNLKNELASGNLTGKEFDEAAKRAGQLQDRIGDVNQRVKNLASDSQKLDGFLSLTQGIVGGFSAVQGLAAAFGDENEDLQRTMVKLQAAMTTLNGIQAVANTLNKDSAALTALTTIQTKAQAAATTLLTFATGGATVAMNVFRVALLATGIGAIVVLLVAAANKMDLFGESVADTTEKLKEQKEAEDALNEKFKEGDQLLIERYQQERDIAKARLKLQGATQAQILEEDKKFLLRKKALLQLEVDDIKLNAEKKQKAIAALNTVENELILNGIETQQAIKDKKAADAAASEKNKKQEEKKATDEDFQKESDKQFLLDMAYEERLARFQKEQAEKKLKADQQAADALAAQREAQRLYDIESLRLNEAAKVQITADTFDIMNNLGEIFLGQQYRFTAIGKVLALTQIAIDTAKAISSLTAASEANPTNSVTYGLAGAAQFISGLARITANVLKAKQVLNGNGAAPSGGGLSGGGAAPPPTRFTPTASFTPSETQKGSRVYVLEKDITDTQGRVRRIRTNAELL